MVCILLIFAAAMMFFPFTCACADMTEGLIYDETDNIRSTVDEDLAVLVAIMKRECAKSPMIKGTYYDAILMDVRMPVMDGPVATRRIRTLDRADDRQIPIIAMTANVFDEDVEHSLEAGMNAHLSKPIVPETMYETIARLIAENSGV